MMELQRPQTKDIRTAVMLTLAVWLSLFGLLLVPQFVFNGPPSVAIALNVMSSFVLALAATFISYRLASASRQPSRGAHYLRLIGAVLLLGLVLAAADAGKDIVLMRWLEGTEPKRNMILYTAGAFAFFVQGLAINSAFYVILRRGAELRESGIELAKVTERAARAEVVAAQAETAATNARLAALRYQLNPHFLFNTLNAISSMVVTNRAAAAEGMLTKLSEFLRGTLALRADALVPLEDELASVANYLEIEGFRLRERLSFEMDCPPELAHVEVPSFILQPLIENAVKHGVAPTSRAVTIRLSVREDQNRLRIDVSDNGGGSGAASGFGLGLQNVRERLESVYGPEGSLAAERLKPGFRVTLTIPITQQDRRFAA